MAARVDSDDEGFSDGEGQETEWDGVRLLVRDDEDSEASDIEDFAEGVPCGPASAKLWDRVLGRGSAYAQHWSIGPSD
jgi:hypothetical protein